MKVVRTFVEGAGIAILLLANLLWPMLSLYHLAIYHNPVSASATAEGFSVDLVLITVFFAVVLAVMDRWSPQQSNPVWAFLLAFWITLAVDLVVFLLRNYRLQEYNKDFPWRLSAQIAVMLATLGMGLFLSIWFPAILRRSVKAARFALAMLGCCIFWMLPQFAFIAIRTHASEPNAFVKPLRVSSTPSASQKRVIWILLDELSYDQVYEHRQPDLKLPYLDELKKESVVFSNVQPEGYFTERILPALFLGRRVDAIRSSLHRDLEIHDAQMSQWVPFDQEASIFGEAKQAGWSTGVVGWYNPYCHILRDVLDSCYWDVGGSFPRDKQPIVNALAFPFDWWLSHFRAPVSRTGDQAHTRDHIDLTRAADALIRNESIRFVFLHLPIPHPPGIYDRKTNTLGVKGSYLDNLALTDKTLGNLLGVIEETAAAPRTTVIISSDHSWRVNMWRTDPSWTAEDERVSQGKFDPRPVLLVHFPGSEVTELRSEPVSELAVHGILESMLKGGIDSQGQLDAWLGEHERNGGLEVAGGR